MRVLDGKRYRLTFAVALPLREGQSVQMHVKVLPGMETQFIDTVTKSRPGWVDLEHFCAGRDRLSWINTRYVVALSEMED